VHEELSESDEEAGGEQQYEYENSSAQMIEESESQSQS
jgi:hypothetical protein